jgi:hypothetical protein
VCGGGQSGGGGGSFAGSIVSVLRPAAVAAEESTLAVVGALERKAAWAWSHGRRMGCGGSAREKSSVKMGEHGRRRRGSKMERRREEEGVAVGLRGRNGENGGGVLDHGAR